jgi:hypothetical protein
MSAIVPPPTVRHAVPRAQKGKPFDQQYIFRLVAVACLPPCKNRNTINCAVVLLTAHASVKRRKKALDTW